MKYLIDYIDYNGQKKIKICNSFEELKYYKSYCLTWGLFYEVYELVKLLKEGDYN